MMEVNRHGITPPIPTNNRSTESAPIDKLKAAKVEPEKPTVSGNITFSEETGLMDEETIARVRKELNDELKQQVKDFERAQGALLNSLDQFSEFKAAQKIVNPHLNLDSVDLALNEDGSLALVGGSLSGDQRSELEQQLNDNDELKASFSQVHDGILSVLQMHSSDFDALSSEDLRGSLKLNELTEKYSRQFTPDGFGQNMPTLEDKINTDPLLFFGMMVDAINPRVSIKV
ncbi:hypothetical protein C3B51_17995 [Pseudoalteromonas rubra]|uniref:Uncharacterized protein n=1 Tax=Pseudoalteromonas rubra TaxID=43658 RepID=A0A4Q7E4E8_9GAMM|nr:hypothetical protein [Pseudoalteromonas rubra]RZM76458.1 hypothetical protein C3B51_17995 [Pseudoalteromonas rubra]